VDAQGGAAWHAYCPALESLGGATSGRTREEALNKINEVIHMIVQELVEEGTAPRWPAMIDSQARWTEEDLKRLKLL
jgi:predicted RNase H-like HicB family nuclease